MQNPEFRPDDIIEITRIDKDWCDVKVKTVENVSVYSREKDITKVLNEYYKNKNLRKNLPDKVYFNDKKKATTLGTTDKRFVTVKAGKEKYDRRIGFLEAYFQAYSGLSKTAANKYLEEIVKDDS